MRKNFGREIALLSLPVLLFGGAALWNSKLKGHFKIKSWSGFGAPRGLFEGKPRLEITDWKRETPSALDFARGISSRWTISTWNGGACPGGATRYTSAGISNPTNLYFAWTRAGKWHRTRFGFGWSEVEAKFFRLRNQPTNHEVQLGLPLDLVPHDAQEVRLRGYLRSFIDCGGTSISAPSASLDKVIKAPGEEWPKFAGSRVSGLKFISANQQWCVPDPIKDPKGDNLEVESLFSASNVNDFDFEPTHSRITDANGKTILEIMPVQWQGETMGRRSVKWKVDTRQLKKHKGPFALRSWVYVDENQWPLSVALPLNLFRSAQDSKGISTYNSKPIQLLR